MSASQLRVPSDDEAVVARSVAAPPLPERRGAPQNRAAAAALRPQPMRQEWAPRPRTARQSQVAPLPGFTATGAAVLATVAATLAAMLDAAISPGLGALFGFVFVMVSVLVALRLGWRDAWAAVALPPLVFVAAAAIAAQVQPADGADWLARTSAAVAAAVLDHPGYLLTGTILAGLAIGYRARVE